MQELHDRHQRLKQKLQSKDHVSIVLVFSGKSLPKYQTSSIYQESPNFYYLSGIWSPDLVFGLIFPRKQKESVPEKEIQEILFIQESKSAQCKKFYLNYFTRESKFRKEQQEQEQIQTFSFDAHWPPWALEPNSGRFAFLRKKSVGTIFSLSVSDFIKSFSEKTQEVLKWYVCHDNQDGFDEKDFGVRVPFTNCAKEVKVLRMSKSLYERNQIQKATNLSCQYHELAQKLLLINNQKRKVLTDFELESLATSLFRKSQATHSYFPIVLTNNQASIFLHGQASGEHLSGNDAKHSTSVLVDVGAQVNGYCSDITRTTLLNPTLLEKEIYKFLVQCLEFLETKAKPGMWIKGIQYSESESLQVLYENYVLKQKPKWKTELLVHSIGHHVGLEVHDPELRPLQEGDCFALEVGYYSGKQKIGIRIEDMYTMGKEKILRLSSKLTR
jgi:Xaa-Pro aminopeptidase